MEPWQIIDSLFKILVGELVKLYIFFVGFYSDYVFTSTLQQQWETGSVSVGVAGPTEADAEITKGRRRKMAFTDNEA